MLLAFSDQLNDAPRGVRRALAIRNATLSIVGIMPPTFVGETSGQQPDVWVPLRMQPRVRPGDNFLEDTPPDKAMWLHVFGRLQPGVSLAEAEARVNAVLQANLVSFYGPAATGERRTEFLDQRLQITNASRGAAPSESRSVISARRAAPRASSRFARFAQAISSRMPTPASSAVSDVANSERLADAGTPGVEARADCGLARGIAGLPVRPPGLSRRD